MSERFVRLVDVEAAYAGAAPVLTDLTLDFTPGWTGIVGANGAGKSTLLALLAGTLTPSAGHRAASEGPIVFVPQRSERTAPLLERFFEDWSKSALAWRARLALDDDGPYRWDTLSFGERKRWHLAAALARAPDVLLIDEPTNHLDDDGIALLVDALSAFDGVGVIVSHDRRVLDPLATRTVELAGGRARAVALPYVEARRTWDAIDDEAARRAEQSRDEARRRAALLDRQRRIVEETSRRISVRARSKGIHDTEARGSGAKFRVAKAAARHSRHAAVARTRSERATTVADGHRVERKLGRDIAFEASPIRARRVCALVLDRLDAGDKRLLDEVHLTVDRGDRIALCGPNGAGKSTLMHALVAACAIEDVFVLPQEIDEDARKRLEDGLGARGPEDRGAMASLCAALAVAPDGLPDDLATRSPGEVRKIAIADALSRRVAVMFLDEPTNHLDLPSREKLADALARYEGTLVTVTHDPTFAEAIDARRVDLADRRLVT